MPKDNRDRNTAHQAMVVGEAYAENMGGGYVGTTENNVALDEVIFLVSEIDRLYAANEALTALNREIAQEIENVKADFGNQQR